MSYHNGSPPDDIADAAGEGLTEIGAAQNANGGGTSAVATALPLAATARVLLASPSTTVERRGSDFFPIAGAAPAHGLAGAPRQDDAPLRGRTGPMDLGELAPSKGGESPRERCIKF